MSSLKYLWTTSRSSPPFHREPVRLEDTIIFALIERARYANNAACYDPTETAYAGLTGSSGASLLDYMLLETERLHATVRRYTSPDEYAFFPHRLPSPVLPLIEFPPVLHPTVTNLNGTIMDMYRDKVLPDLCASGDDGHHGSTVVADIAVLQAMSKHPLRALRRRVQVPVADGGVHRADRGGDTDGIMALPTPRRLRTDPPPHPRHGRHLGLHRGAAPPPRRRPRPLPPPAPADGAD